MYDFFFFSSRRRHTRWNCDWSSDVCSSDLVSSASRSMDAEARLKSIMDVLDQLAEDTSVPRNIRRGATEAKNRLKIGRASCRERVEVPVVAVALKKKKEQRRPESSSSTRK